METISIIIGLLILVATFLDFFYTTLSGNGFGTISRRLNDLLSKALLSNKNKFFFDHSGPIHLLVTNLVWLILILAGAYIIFIANDTMVVHSSSNRSASATEIFYFTCYTVSSLGIGDFVPGNDISRILAGILSFSGFVFLTIGLTYMLSVINASLERKELALYISSMGENIQELYEFTIMGDKMKAITDNGSDLKQMILKNASSRVFFPITQRFLAWKRIHSSEVQLASLYEVLNIGRKEFDEDSVEFAKLTSLIKAIEYYHELGLENPAEYHHDHKKLNKLRKFWQKYRYDYERNPKIDDAMDASLKNAGWSWEEVYRIQENERKSI